MTIDDYQTETMRTAAGMDYKKHKKADATIGLLINITELFLKCLSEKGKDLT